MIKATNGNEMHELRFLKRNAYKAVDEALKRSKSDELISVNEMEGLKDEVEPLLNNFYLCVSKHIEMLEKKEGDNDEEIDIWEVYVELVRMKWQQSLEFWKHKEIASDDTSEAVVATERAALWLGGVMACPPRGLRAQMLC